MAKIDGGRIFAKALKKEGVECVFTLSGGHIMKILYGCREEGINVIDVRHECVGGFAAGAYSMVKGQPGVLITTAGPGVTNTTTAMAELYDTGIPIIHIGGAAPQSEQSTGSLQDVRSFEAMSIFTKWARKVVSANRIPEYVTQAFRHALDSSPGPVYMEIAFDVLDEIYEEGDLYWPEKTRSEFSAFGDPAAIEKAVDLLLEAERPVMIVGENARFCGAYKEYLQQLSDYLSLPVYPMNAARGVFANEQKNQLWTLGGYGMFGADLVLELGVNNNYLIGKGTFFPENAKVIQVHPDKKKIGFNIPAEVGIVADVGAVAMQMLECAKKKTKGENISRTSWISTTEELTGDLGAAFFEAAESEIHPPHPGRLAWEVATFIEREKPDMHIIADGGDSAQWIQNIARATYPGQIVTYGPLGTVGTGQGFALGAWAADKKPVLLYIGDGSFGFYPMEFDTYLRNNIPVVCVISNDSAWGMIKLSEELCNMEEVKKNGHLATTLAHMRKYEKMADIWDGVGIQVNRYQDVIPAIRKVVDSGKPGIVNVQVDEHIMSPATAEFGEEGGK